MSMVQSHKFKPSNARTTNEVIVVGNTHDNSSPVKPLLKRVSRITGTVAAVMAATLSLFTPSAAHAISGGSKTSQPWVVQTLGFTNNSPDICSGVAINSLMILTVKHCDVSSVLYPDGGSAYVASAHEVPNADIQVIVLTQEHPLEKYPKLGPDFLAIGRGLAPGASGLAYGYGSGPTEWPQKSMRLTVKVHGVLENDSTVDRIYMRESNGEIQSGDSGGPLLVDGLLVGIEKGFGYDETGQRVVEFRGLSKAFPIIRQLQHAREMRAVKEDDYYPGPWISAVDVNKGYLSATLGSQLLNKGKPITIWVNGNYASGIVQGACSACTKTDINGGAIIKLLNTVKDGDLIQIGLGSATGRPQDSELLYENRINGIEAVTLENGKAVVRVSPTLFNSEQRVIIWLNGTYYSEVYKNQVYYGDSFIRAGGGATIYVGAATPKTHVQIGVVTGTPGLNFGTPSTSKILYSATFDGTLEISIPQNPAYTVLPETNAVPKVWPATVNFPTKTSPARR